MRGRFRVCSDDSMDVHRNDPANLQAPVTEEHSSPGKWTNVNATFIINVHYEKHMR